MHLLEVGAREKMIFVMGFWYKLFGLNVGATTSEPEKRFTIKSRKLWNAAIQPSLWEPAKHILTTLSGTRRTQLSSGPHRCFVLPSVRGARSSSGTAGGDGSRDAAPRHGLQTAAMRTRSRRDGTMERTRPRRSSGRSDHCAAPDDSAVLP
jgi:hypothetical protein